MPRIRSIKPEFFAHDVLAALPPLSRLAFVGLWCHADRNGRLEDRPVRLKAAILPYDTAADFRAILAELEHAGFIVRYEVDGRALIDIPGFRRHQRPHAKEPESALPAPPLPLTSTAARPTCVTPQVERGPGESGVEVDPGRNREVPSTDLAPPQTRTDTASSQIEPVLATAAQHSNTLGREGKETITGREGGPEEGKPSAGADGENTAAPRRKCGRPPTPRHPETDALCRHLEQRAREWKSDARVDANARRSRDGMDALLRLDGRDPAKVRAVIDWLFTGGYAPHNEFDWRPNILSGASLRKHWDRIETQHDREAREEAEWTGR
jgi:hypothetical protein